MELFNKIKKYFGKEQTIIIEPEKEFTKYTITSLFPDEETMNESLGWFSTNRIKENTKALNEVIKEMYDGNFIEGNDISDTIHTFGELYDYRMLYNALFANEIAQSGKYEVYKSKRHSDGELCFGGGWFIVTIILPTGAVDNHYKEEYWDLFKCPEVEQEPYPYDGHTPADVAERMRKYLKQ